MTQLRGVPGAVDDVAVAYRNDIEDDRALIWDAFGRVQGVLHGLVMTEDAGSLSVTFTAGAAVVEERGTDINGDKRGYYLFEDVSFVVTFAAPDAASRNDAVVVCWADPQYGALGASVSGPGPQVVVVKGVSGSTVPRTDTEINTAVGPGGWFRYADVIIAPGNTQIAPANVTRSSARSAPQAAAKVRRVATQSIPASVGTAIAWDTIVKDPGGMVPTVASGIKVPVTGDYQITGQICMNKASASVLFHVVIRVNGADVLVPSRTGMNTPNAPTDVNFSVGEWPLVAGDVVTIAVFHTDTAAISTFDGSTIHKTELSVRRLR